jgi:hypothetical protein
VAAPQPHTIEGYTGWEKCDDLQLALMDEEKLPNEGDIIVMQGMLVSYQVKILKIKRIWRNRSSESDQLYMKVKALRKIIEDDPDAQLESRHVRQEQQHIEDKNYYSPWGLHESDEVE